MVTARTPLAQHRAAPRHRSALGMLMVLLIVVGGTAGAAIGHMTAATAQAPAAQTTQEPTGPATATALPAPRHRRGHGRGAVREREGHPGSRRG